MTKIAFNLFLDHATRHEVHGTVDIGKSMFVRRTILILLSALAYTVTVGSSVAQSSAQITLAELEKMFANIRAKTTWDVDGPLLWGYFFFDPSIEKLQKAATELGAAGYRVVGIEPVKGRQIFRLHVERIEIHTPSTLYARNHEFYALAERLSLQSYDGMDVGPIRPTAR